MTTEEKAKAYDEAIEKAEKVLKTPYTAHWDKHKELIEYLFPELAESEDEKVRKALYKMAKVPRKEIYEVEGITKEQALAWFEKQGEQKPVNKDLEDTEEIMIYQGEKYTRCYQDALDKFACKYPKTVPPPSKKYAKYSDTDLVIAVKAGAEWQMKQKPVEWSEEDEKMLSCAEEAVKAYFSEIGNEGSVIHWLKSLKNRCAYQLKQEWSEEEIEKAAQEWDVKASFKPFYISPTGVKQDITTHKESFKAGINWILKSLRPQSHWKPSHEQMEALDDFIYAKYPNIEKYGAAVKSLYQDLKKLKG